MAKIKNPLLSLGAIGNLSKAITFVRRRKTNIVEAYPEPKQPNTALQLEWRHMYQKATALWHALAASEQQEWESQARPKHMTGFAWFISQALKPNPGLYLPLQGGTMAGLIDMDGHHIHGLPLSIHPEDPWRRIDSQTYIQPYLYHEGARVYHNVAQSIPSITNTILAFNSERWDNDVIHDNAVNNSRLTCKTVGKYLIIAQIQWETHSTGNRSAYLRLNGATLISFTTDQTSLVYGFAHIVSTIYNLAVNDYVEVQVYHQAGPAINVPSTAQITPEFMMERIGV